jgi:hypothetical protein
MTAETRLIIFHKHPVSARTRFLKLGYGGVCGFEPLPKLAQVLEEEEPVEEGTVVNHPAKLLSEAEERLKLEPGSLKIEGEFLQRVDVPQGMIEVFLAGIKGHDTPDETLAENDARLHLITEIRTLAPAEMELLRRAYTAIMGG